MSVNILKADEKSLPKLSAIAHRAITEALGFFPTNARDYYAKNLSAESLKKRLEESGALVLGAWGEGIAKGFMLCAPPEGNVGTIIWILVDAPARSTGIGKMLFEEACAHYRSIGCHKIKLTAPTEQARQFYLNLGMREEGFHPKHWWGVDFWSFGKDLA